MKTTMLLALFFVSSIAFAPPGTYEGSGSGAIPGQEAKKYSVKMVVKEITPKEVIEVAETYQMEGKDPVAHTLTFHFSKDGTLRVRRNGEVVGCGYCFPHKDNNKWCDYNLEAEVGKIHVNMYYSDEEKKVFRMGDMIQPTGITLWSETLSLVSENKEANNE